VAEINMLSGVTWFFLFVLLCTASMADANGATSGLTYFMKSTSFLLDPPLTEPADFHRPAG